MALTEADERIARHMFRVLGVAPRVWEQKIGGSVLLLEKPAPDVPGVAVVLTCGASRLAPPSGQLPTEFAIEIADGQQDAALVVLQNLCDDLAAGSLSRARATPWRSSTPLLDGTSIYALVATASRYGDSFDTVRDEAGQPIGQVLTIRLLTYPESWVVSSRGFDQLVTEAGGLANLIDVTRDTSVYPTLADIADRPVLVTDLHEQYPPIWVTCDRVDDDIDLFHSTTGAESPEYLADAGNYQAWTCGLYLERFPWATSYLTHAVPGTVAHFTDDTGAFELESSTRE